MLIISGNGKQFTTGGAQVDPDFASVILLASFDGADGDISAVDDSPLGLSMSAVGACSLSNAEPVFGATGLAVNAASGSTGYMTISDSSAFDFGTGDFTIEGWARQVYENGGWWLSILGNFQGGAAGSWSVFVTSTGQTMQFVVDGVPTLAGASGWDTTLRHFAVSRNGATIRMFRDGVLDGKSTSYGAVSVGNVAQNLIVGGNNAGVNDRWRGHIDELRVTKGVGRYNSDASFTVPTEPYLKA